MQVDLFLLQISGEPLAQGFEAMKRISLKLLFRVLIDLFSVIVLIRFVYYPVYKKSDLNFTYFVFNLVIFLICFLLNKVDLSMGAAFGLFAVFSMLRYRTEEISIKDMTYLFLVIAIGLISAVTKVKDASDIYEYAFLAIINFGIILLAFVFESRLFFKKEAMKLIVYDNVELLRSDNQLLLVDDLRKRTGLNVQRVAIIKIDFVNDSAQLKVYYFE